MNYSIDFHPKVKFEAREAYLWYESQSDGLGRRFMQELETGIELITEAPLIWPKFRRIYHRYLLTKFPFSIYYSVEDSNLYVYAVAHTSRKPYYWKERKQGA
jgi:hypothetical protein